MLKLFISSRVGSRRLTPVATNPSPPYGIVWVVEGAVAPQQALAADNDDDDYSDWRGGGSLPACFGAELLCIGHQAPMRRRLFLGFRGKDSDSVPYGFIGGFYSICSIEISQPKCVGLDFRGSSRRSWARAFSLCCSILAGLQHVSCGCKFTTCKQRGFTAPQFTQ